MTERTLTALRNSFDGKVYIIIKGDELQKQFLKDAESEGFHFGTNKPTDSSTDDVIALEPNKQLSYPEDDTLIICDLHLIYRWIKSGKPTEVSWEDGR